jgi:hypothetical protein
MPEHVIGVVFVGLLLAGLIYFMLTGRLTAQWSVVRVLLTEDPETIRVQLKLVTAAGKVLKHKTVRGSEESWFFEDAWGEPGDPCSPEMSLTLRLVWLNHCHEHGKSKG